GAVAAVAVTAVAAAEAAAVARGCAGPAVVAVHRPAGDARSVLPGGAGAFGSGSVRLQPGRDPGDAGRWRVGEAGQPGGNGAAAACAVDGTAVVGTARASRVGALERGPAGGGRGRLAAALARRRWRGGRCGRA